MRTALVLLGAVVMLLLPVASEVDAQAPVCFATPPFVDVFVWFVKATGGNQFAGSGRDLEGDRPQTVSGFVVGQTATVGFATHSGTPDTVPVTGGGTIDLATGTGSGSCFAPDFASCGSFTFTSITCPSGTTADATGKARTTGGRVQGVVP